LFTDWIAEPPAEAYDLLVSTPPYLPDVKGFDSIRRYSPVAGIELLTFLIQNEVARHSYVTISSLVSADVEKLARRHGTKMEPIGKAIAVPFRVPAALRSTTYISTLLESGRLEFKAKERYPLWHRIITFKLKHNEKAGDE
jgi:hypothetical protein